MKVQLEVGKTGEDTIVAVVNLLSLPRCTINLVFERGEDGVFYCVEQKKSSAREAL